MTFVYLSLEAPTGFAGHVPEFAHAPLYTGHTAEIPTATVDLEAWKRADPDLLSLDRSVHAAEDEARAAGLDAWVLRLANRDRNTDWSAVSQVLSRYQRLFPRRNRASSRLAFACAQEALFALHDLAKPLVRADWEHALDTWQWVLRLHPTASAALQLAALFHDVERLVSESDARVEHQAVDYLSFKARHAQRGSELCLQVLASCGLPHAELERTRWLIREHERPGSDGELATLNDADGLSFFSLNSPGYLRYFGPEQTTKKIAYTLGRMGTHARHLLTSVRLERFIAERVRDPTHG